MSSQIKKVVAPAVKSDIKRESRDKRLIGLQIINQPNKSGVTVPRDTASIYY